MFDLSHIHPMIIHFPIALIIIGFLADVTGLIFKKDFFNKMATVLITLGAIGAIAAYISGENAGEGIEEGTSLGAALEVHQDAAALALIITLIATIVRLLFIYLKKFVGIYKYISVILLLLSVIAISRTGFYGGDLVYKHGAGVTISSEPDIKQTPK